MKEGKMDGFGVGSGNLCMVEVWWLRTRCTLVREAAGGSVESRDRRLVSA